MISGLFFPAIPLLLAQPGAATPLPAITPDEQERAVAACSDNSTPRDAALLDARALRTAAGLGAAIEEAGAQAVIIFGGDFTGEDMRELSPFLESACFVDTTLRNTDWRATAIAGLQFDGVDLTGVQAGRAYWPNAKFHASQFEGGDFSSARLPEMRFTSARRGADFGGVSFERADLRGAVFECGITVDSWCLGGSDMDLTGSDLAGAMLNTLGLWNPDGLAGARIENTVVSPRNLESLVEADIAGPVILRSELALDRATDASPSVQISPDEARALISATKRAQRDVASFDCAKAATKVESLICGEYNSDLRTLDRELAESWRKARAAGAGDLAEQRRWLASRASCEDWLCLRDMYRLRIAEISASFEPLLALAPDQSVTYHSDVVPLPRAMRRGELYERILPALRDASWQHVTLTGREDGSVSAEGDALGANAHLCALKVAEARLSPATGWYSATNAAGQTVELFRVSGRDLQLRYSGNLGNTPEAASDFISCGARASFGDGIDLSPAD